MYTSVSFLRLRLIVTLGQEPRLQIGFVYTNVDFQLKDMSCYTRCRSMLLQLSITRLSKNSCFVTLGEE